jgi:hypothetical protein
MMSWRSTLGWLVVAAVVAIIGLTVLRLGARGEDARARFDRLSTDEILSRVQRAMAEKGSYHAFVVGQNLVLPRWGGVDSGSVDVKLDGSAASASMQRAGDGLYAIILVDGQTYFHRSTCPSFTRVPGGGAEVLTPFILSDLTGSDRRTVPIGIVGNPAFVDATTPQLGHVVLELDPESFLPLRLGRHDNNQQDGSSTWEFSSWGEGVHVERPSGDIPDRGPGGNPC